MITRFATVDLLSSMEEMKKQKALMRIDCICRTEKSHSYCGAINIIPSREQKSDSTIFPEEPIHPDVSTARERSAPVSDTKYTMFDLRNSTAGHDGGFLNPKEKASRMQTEGTVLG
jgi:hypothetical protein